MSELVTKEFLKSFGDKCKKIFKPQTTVVNAPDDNEYKYLIINTDLPWLDTWVVNIDISGKGFTNSYNSYYGDIKFFGNISNQGNWEGRGYSLVDNEVIGILVDNYPSGVEHKTSFVVQFFEPVKQVAIDIINYLGDGTSNVNINSVEFTHSLGSAFSYAYILGNVDYKPSTIGKIIRLEQQSEVEQLLFKLPKQNDDSDLDGEYINIPEDTTQINSVNDSKWAKYIKTKHNIKLEEGDLKEAIISFGGDNNTEINVPSLEINNSVQGNTGGEWFGKVQVNSKGLVTAVAPEEPLQVATDTVLGGIQIGYEQSTVEKNYPVSIDENNKAYVHVPWNDTDTWNKVADSDNLGLIKIGYTENDKNYPVQLDSDNRAFVNVPWVSSEYNIATKDTAGLIKIGYSSSNTINLPIKLDSSGKAYAVKQQDIFAAYAAKIQLSNLNSYDYCYILPPIDGTGQDHFSSSYLQQDWREPLLDTFTITIDSISQQQGYSSTKTIRFENPYEDHQITIIVTKDDSVRVCNMFSADIMNEGVKLLPKQTIELVFTYWHYNNVTFNGGFSV